MPRALRPRNNATKKPSYLLRTDAPVHGLSEAVGSTHAVSRERAENISGPRANTTATSDPTGATPFSTSHPKRVRAAPPIDLFYGNTDADIFADWIASLQRAAVWNGWGEQEVLIQLAGHLRGTALQE